MPWGVGHGTWDVKFIHKFPCECLSPTSALIGNYLEQLESTNLLLQQKMSSNEFFTSKKTFYSYVVIIFVSIAKANIPSEKGMLKFCHRY